MFMYVVLFDTRKVLLIVWNTCSLVFAWENFHFETTSKKKLLDSFTTTKKKLLWFRVGAINRRLTYTRGNDKRTHIVSTFYLFFRRHKRIIWSKRERENKKNVIKTEYYQFSFFKDRVLFRGKLIAPNAATYNANSWNPITEPYRYYHIVGKRLPI